jgi:hypothetical protein
MRDTSSAVISSVRQRAYARERLTYITALPVITDPDSLAGAEAKMRLREIGVAAYSQTND